MFASSTACLPTSRMCFSISACVSVDHLLDARRVDAAVLDQLGQRQPGRLAADVVEGADDDHAGRVVHDHVHAGALLEGADVAAFAADDAALHVVAGDVHGADGGVGGVLGGVAVDGGGQDARGPSPRWPAAASPRAAACGAAISSASSRSSRSSSSCLGLLAVQAADLVQLLRLLLDQRLDLLAALLELGRAFA